MQTQTRLVISFCTLLLFGLIISRQHVAAKISLGDPAGPVGAILYQNAAGHYHTVQRGETLFSIARHYNVSVGQLLEMNQQIRNPNLIYAGQSMWIPARETGSSQSRQTCGINHTVQYGDSLFGIAYWYGADLNEVMVANSIVDPDYIYAGASLYIPCR